MQTAFTIIHNSRCSKSCEALELLRARGIQPQVVNYLEGDLTQKLLEKIISTLNLRPKEILRAKELASLNLTLNLEQDQEVIAAILLHPEILERPIVLQGERALIARPPQRVLELLG
jgi:arsenate reductase (glutaredoxin)